MKQVVFAAIVFAGLLIGCNSDGGEHKVHDSTATKQPPTSSSETGKIAEVKPVFAGLNEDVSKHIKNIFDHYIHVKTALVNSNPTEAKNGANAILSGLKNFDKSLFQASQKEAYDKSAGDIKAAATAIASTGDLEKQREHFAHLSMEAYELAKSFGAGRTVYHEHCPMAFNNKGAMWLSENKEISNPYFGEKMMKCGTVEEIIEK